MTLLAAADLLFASRIQEAARGTGVEVTVAPRDSDLLARARELCPAALALDLSGVLDSPALIRALRAEPTLQGLRIFGYSGHEQVELMDAARKAGADAVFARGELTRKLPELLKSL